MATWLYVALSDPGVIWDFTIIWSKQAICCAFFGSEIISLTFLDILNANLSEIETRISHFESDLFVFLQYLCRKVVRPNQHQNTKYLQTEWWHMKLTNLNARIQVFRVYIGVKLAETIQCNQKSTFYSNELSNLLSGKECKKSSCHTKVAITDTFCI